MQLKWQLQKKLQIQHIKLKQGKNKEFEFQVKVKELFFAGFMKAYTEGSDNPEAALDSTEKILPNIKVGTVLELEN